MKISQIPHNQLIQLSIIFSLLLIVTLLPREVIFDETKVVCIHKYLLGFQCPLCGMTRAVYQISHLQFVSAIGYNAVVVLLPVYLAVDIATIFFRQKALLVARKIVVAFIFAGFLLLYAFRIANHFNWL